jgi:hypothetical protein
MPFLGVLKNWVGIKVSVLEVNSAPILLLMYCFCYTDSDVLLLLC